MDLKRLNVIHTPDELQNELIEIDSEYDADDTRPIFDYLDSKKELLEMYLLPVFGPKKYSKEKIYHDQAVFREYVTGCLGEKFADLADQDNIFLGTLDEDPLDAEDTVWYDLTKWDQCQVFIKKLQAKLSKKKTFENLL